MTASSSPRDRKGQIGQSIVEITLITPLVLIALYIPADFGVAFFMGNIVATVARDGARIGSGQTKTGGNGADPDFTTQDATAVKDAIVGQLPRFLKSRQVIISFFEDDGTPCMETIQVTVQGTYPIFLYQLMRLFGVNVSNFTISRTTRMRYNYQLASNNTMCTSPSVNQETYDITDS
jgi:hypothetical protein